MIQPPFLRQGDRVKIVAPAKIFNIDALKRGIEILKSWGLKVEEGKHLYAAHHIYAGSDSQRLEDMQQALDDAEVKAIFCARGGYGTARFIDQLNHQKFKDTPKWICGFSDITAMLSHVNAIGYQGLHALMPTQFGNAEYEDSVLALKSTLFGDALNYEVRHSPHNKKGTGSGILVGGNLTILHCIIGTASEVNWNGKILLLEDIGEQLYHIDRMMVHLKRANKLKDLVGMVVGHLTDMKDSGTPFGKTAEEIIFDAVKEYHYPVLFDFPAGHASPNLPLILGGEVTIEVTNTISTLKYKMSNSDNLV